MEGKIFMFTKWYLQSKVLDSQGFLKAASSQMSLDLYLGYSLCQH